MSVEKPRVTFDRPQFNLLPDEKGVRFYANVDNRMEVLARNTNYYVAVAVPTGLFTLMADVFKVPLEEEVRLSMDEVGDRFVFSIFYGSDNLVDLWDYSRKTLPAWILTKQYRL